MSVPLAAPTSYVASSGPAAAYRKTGGLGDGTCAALTATAAIARTTNSMRLMLISYSSPSNFAGFCFAIRARNCKRQRHARSLHERSVGGADVIRGELRTCCGVQEDRRFGRRHLRRADGHRGDREDHEQHAPHVDLLFKSEQFRGILFRHP